VVHDLATETGRLAQEIANSPRPPTYSEAWSYAEMKAHASEYEDKEAKRILESMNRPIEWYKLLIEVSNHVFYRREYAPA
jgi:hypothetical protein